MSNIQEKIAGFAKRLHELEQEWNAIKDEVDGKIAAMKHDLEMAQQTNKEEKPITVAKSQARNRLATSRILWERWSRSHSQSYSSGNWSVREMWHICFQNELPETSRCVVALFYVFSLPKTIRDFMRAGIAVITRRFRLLNLVQRNIIFQVSSSLSHVNPC